MNDENKTGGDYRHGIFTMIDAVSESDPVGRLEVFQKAAQIADEQNDGEFAYSLRMELIKLSGEANRREVGLVAFAWCLNYADKEMGGPNQSLLWRYKWITDGLTAFPEISRAQIDQTIADMARRYTDAGYGLKAVHQIKLTTNLEMGDFGKVDELVAKWEKAAPDALADCEACQINARTTLYLRLGKVDKAMETAEPLFAGKLKCEEIPEHTVGDVVLPLVKSGQVARARQIAELKIRRLVKEQDFLLAASAVMAFFALDDQLPRALKMLESLSKTAALATNVHKQLHFYCAAQVVMGCLEKAGRTSVTLRLDAQTPGYQKDSVYTPAVLGEAMLARAREIAARFDKRNGNAFISGVIQEHVDLVKLYPLEKKGVIGGMMKKIGEMLG
jgi:hypothetical protein